MCTNVNTMTPPVLKERFQPRFFTADDLNKLNTMLYAMAIVHEEDHVVRYLAKSIYLATGDAANLYALATPDHLIHVVYGCSEEMKALMTVYITLLGGKPTYLYRCMFENDPDAVVCEYVREPSQAFRNTAVNVREVSFEEIEERAYRFFTNTAQTAPKTLHVGVGFEPWRGLYPS
ncbi:MAG: hypothetical protein QXH32_09870 [Candidatus Caldarchaeum sp.]